MAEENKGQESEQTQEPVQGEESAPEPAETQQNDEPAKEKGEGLLMPILYAVLAGVGAFTLVMIIGIVVTFLTRPSEAPSETPSAEPSSHVTLAPSPTETETQEPGSESSSPDDDAPQDTTAASNEDQSENGGENGDTDDF